MSVREITIGTDYARVPGGRYRKHGDFSGEDFREAVLVPALKDYDQVVVHLDGTASYTSSFLEEAFGGLIREGRFSFDELQSRLRVDARASRYAIYVQMVGTFMRDAATEAENKRRTRVA